MSTLKPKEIIFITSVLALIVLFFIGLGSALVPLAFSSVLAYASLPIVKKLEKLKLSRGQSTLLVLIGVFTLITILLLSALPPIVNELSAAISAAPETLSSALIKLESICSEFGLHIPYDRESLLSFISEYSKKISSEVITTGAQLIKSSVSNFASMIIALLALTMIPVFFFYVIKDYENITAAIFSLVPKSLRAPAQNILSQTDVILSGYIRGQLLVCCILSALYTLCLLLVGVHFAIVIGIATGLLSIIPYVGFSLGFAMAILSALAHYSDWTTLIYLIASYMFVQFLESFYITPKIVGNQVGLSPFKAILALIIMGNLFGFIGLFLAIPFGAIMKIFISLLIEKYKATEFYNR